MDVGLRKQMAIIIRALYFQLEERWSSLTREYTASTAQQYLLFILFINDTSLTITEISNIGCWHISTVTRLLKTLIQERYVVVSKAKFSNRTKCVEITEKGKTLIQNIVAILVNAQDHPYDLSDFTEDEISQFLNLGLKILRKQRGDTFVHWVQESDAII